MLLGATNSAVPAAIAILTNDEIIGRSRTFGRAAGGPRENQLRAPELERGKGGRTLGHRHDRDLDGGLFGEQRRAPLSAASCTGKRNRGETGTHDAHEGEGDIADVGEDGDELEAQADGADEALDLDPERDCEREGAG